MNGYKPSQSSAIKKCGEYGQDMSQVAGLLSGRHDRILVVKYDGGTIAIDPEGSLMQ